MMKTIFDDPINGILVATAACFGAAGTFMTEPDSPTGMIAIIVQSVLTGLFLFRLIRIWRNKEYNPPKKWLPWLKFTDAALWFTVILIWWMEVNSHGGLFGIGMLILIAVFAAKELYDAVKTLIVNKKES